MLPSILWMTSQPLYTITKFIEIFGELRRTRISSRKMWDFGDIKMSQMISESLLQKRLWKVWKAQKKSHKLGGALWNLETLLPLAGVWGELLRIHRISHGLLEVTLKSV